MPIKDRHIQGGAILPVTVITPTGMDSSELGAPVNKYMGSYYKALAAASDTVTVPNGTTAALIHAEGGAVYWEINPSGDASATSPGYVADGATGLIPAISNLTTLKIYGASGAKAHIEFYA